MKYGITTYTYYCPNCKQIIKTKQHNEGFFIVCILFLPIGLLALLVKAIINATTKKNKYGEEIVKCKNCGKQVVISNFFNATVLLKDDDL